MSASTNLTTMQKNRAVGSVRILSWLAVVLFLIAYFLIPMGITVFWSTYLLFFGPVIVVDVAAIAGFIVCRLTGRRISFAYLLISLVILFAVWYFTWFELRLKWYEVFTG
jgi:hypothetical protein